MVPIDPLLHDVNKLQEDPGVKPLRIRTRPYRAWLQNAVKLVQAL